MKDKSGIYKWTSPSGKMYIGQSVNLRKRKSTFLNFKHQYGGQKIDNARLKYSHIEDWQYEVLEYCSVEKLNEREAYWIGYFDTMVNGYNCTSGGDQETKYTDEVKKRMRDKLKLRRVCQYTLNGEYIRTWECGMDASRELNICYRHIYSVCENKGRRNQAGGYIWGFEDNNPNHSRIAKYTKKIRKGNNHPAYGKLGGKCWNAKQIVQLDMNWNPIKSWDCIHTIKSELGIGNTTISNVLHGRGKSAGGYKWMFEKDYQNELKLYMYHILLNEMKEEAA